MEYITHKIVTPDGYEIDKDKCTLEEIVFRKKQPERVRSFDELSDKFGYPRITYWPTKLLGSTAVELGKLLQIRKQWIGDWVPDYDDVYQDKHCIVPSRLGLRTITLWVDLTVMSFPTFEMADDFLNTFKSQLEIAKPLI